MPDHVREAINDTRKVNSVPLRNTDRIGNIKAIHRNESTRSTTDRVFAMIPTRDLFRPFSTNAAIASETMHNFVHWMKIFDRNADLITFKNDINTSCDNCIYFLIRAQIFTAMRILQRSKILIVEIIVYISFKLSAIKH